MSIFTLDAISFLDAHIIVVILCSIAEVINTFIQCTLCTVVTYQITG